MSTFKANRPADGETVTLHLRNMGQGEFRLVAESGGTTAAGGALMLASRNVVTGFGNICPMGDDIDASGTTVGLF